MAIELPEALKLAGQMQDELPGKTIDAVHLERCESLIRQGFINLDEIDLAGRTVEAVNARGKWIFGKLEPDTYLLLALETGGRILYHPDETSLPKKFHVKVDFADGSFLSEQIVGWGWAKAVQEDELAQHRYPGRLGVSPLDGEAFSLERFCQIIDRHPTKAAKQVLLMQGEIAGIGNGYLQDILFRAQVHPKRKLGELDKEGRRALHAAIVAVMSEAVALGGRDSECDLYGNPGGYRAILDRDMKGEPCPRCGTPIEKLNVLGSSNYVCPSCQK